MQGQPILYQQDPFIEYYGIKTISTTYQVNDIQYKFYFLGGSKSDFYEGIGIYLRDEMNPSQCKAKLESILRENKIDLKNKQLNVYLAGGIPFKSGLLSDVYLNKKKKVKRVIYGILTPTIPDSLLNQTFYELCNASDFDHKFLLSPNCKSTNRGLSDIACLLGYLNHGGSKSSDLLIGCANYINFAPMMISLKKIIERNNVNGLDILTFCSSLFAFIRNVLPTKICPDNKIFEYTFHLCCFISRHNNNECRNSNFANFPIVKIEDKKDMRSFGPYFWTSDANENSNSSRLEFTDYTIILQLYDQINSIFLISPFSIHYAFECSIVRGKNHEYLYLMKSPLKDLNSQNYVQIIDPMTGLVETKELDQFSKEQNENDNFFNEQDRIEQIIMFNFDESKFMYEKFNNNDIHFYTAGIQYLTTFVNRNYGYRHLCIQGIVSFNNTVKIRSPLSPYIKNFEEKLFNSIKPNSTPKLLDSLLFSCKEIINFRTNKDNDKEMFGFARSRIVVISSGKDVKSNSKLDFVVKELIKAKIVVDAIILNNNNDDCKLLCSICHATGGVALKPQNPEDGLSIIEKNSFLNIDERKNNISPLIPNDRFSRQSRLKPEQITEEFMNKVVENSTIDKELLNKDLLLFTGNLIRLSTPRYAYEKKVYFESSFRNRRIFKEIRRAAELDDPELKIFIYQTNFDIWNVFIKSTEQTSYGPKWWNLNVRFPLFYPIEPPVIKFLSIPYHMNVSTEGYICHEILDKSYIPSKSVVYIFEEIKEIFLLPCLISPIRTDAYFLYLTDRDKYDLLAKESAVYYAKNDYNEFINQSRIIIDNPDFKISPLKHSPPYLISQITGKPIPHNNLILASSGIYYDKEDLKQLISSNKNPICVVTGKILTEKIEDIDTIDNFDDNYGIDLVYENNDTI